MIAISPARRAVATSVTASPWGPRPAGRLRKISAASGSGALRPRRASARARSCSGEGVAAIMAVLRTVGAGGAYWPAGVTTIVPYIPSGSWMTHSYLKMPAVGKVSW
jgi:hypothetical protein